MTISRRTLLSAVGLGALATPLAGCLGEPSATTSSEAGQGPRLRLAMLQPPRSGFNPLSDDAFKLNRWNVIESLVGLDDDGIPVPKLALAWEQRSDTEWVFTLREDVRFHDGTAFTAQTAAASLTAAANAAPVPRILNKVELSASVEGDRLVVTTGTRDPLLPNRLSSPQLCMLSPAAYQQGVVDPRGTATGPFILTEVNGTASATMERNDSYWGGVATASGIDADFVPDGTARAAALRTGTADIVEAVPIGQAASIEEALLHEVQMPRSNILHLNCASGVFVDAAMRAAVREAIDTSVIVEKVYEGRADQGVGVLGPAIGWAEVARQRVDAAQILARRARAARPEGISVRLGTYTDRAELPEVAVQVQQMLENAGFRVTQDVREYQYIEQDALSGAFDMFILSRAVLLDSGDPVATMVSDYSSTGVFNLSQFSDPEVDELLAAAAEALPGTERQDAAVRAESLILALDAMVPLVHERVIQGEQTTTVEAVRDPRERELVSMRTTRR